MDIFLLSSCRFFIGNNSGITNAAIALGTPYLMTNCVPFAQYSHTPNNIMIFKLHRSRKTGQLHSFSRCLESLLSLTNENSYYEEFGIDLVENTPEEIRDATAEMLDKLQGHPYSPEDEKLQEKFLSLRNSFNYPFTPRVGREFLKKYSHLMED